MYDVITVGSATIDVFCKTEADLISIYHSKQKEELLVYPVGSKILIRDLKFLIGGGGTNTAVSFSRLGLKTGYLGKLGKNYEPILNLLKKEKIDFLGEIDKTRLSGYSVILDSIKEDRTILTYKGANDYLSLDKIKKSNLNAKCIYFSSMTGPAFKEMLKIAKYFKTKNKKTIIAFNPSSYIASKGIAKLPLIKYTDILVLNKEELNLILGNNKNEEITTEKMLKIHYFGPKIIVVTDGANKLFAYYNEEIYSIKPKRVKVVETTGAGDAFASTFVAAHLMKKNIEDALKMALINSVSVITNYGAKNILLKKSELIKKLKTTRIKIKKIKIKSS